MKSNKELKKKNWLNKWFGWFNKNPIHRKANCDVCDSALVEHSLRTKILIDGSEDTIYEERCIQCGNLLYGWVKKSKQGDPDLLNNIPSSKEMSNSGGR